MDAFVDIVLPPNEEGADAIVIAWLKRPGDAVEMHDPILEISTDKVTMEVAAPATGVLRECLVKQDDTVTPGTVLGRIEAGVTADAVHTIDMPPSNGAPLQTTSPISEPAIERTATRLSPLVKRMLKENNLDPAHIAGTGRGGRITGNDIKAFLTAGTTPTHEPVQATQTAAYDAGEHAELIPHSPMRRQIAQHMVESMLKTAPHVTSLFEADMSAVVDHRSRHKDEFATRGVKLTYTAYFTYAAVQAMYAVPEVNSRWLDEGLEVFKRLNIGIATALGSSGLIVPVIHDAQNLGLFGIAKQLGELTEQARAGALPRNAVQGGTFTITNHGVSGSLLATPIINQPQSAILGIGKMDKRVVVREEKGRDTMQILPMIYVTLTIDHRALDGFQANTFLARFVDVIENWT